MWLLLIEIQPQLAQAAGGISRDDFIDNVAADIIDKIPEEYDMILIRRSHQMNMTPTMIVLFQVKYKMKT